MKKTGALLLSSLFLTLAVSGSAIAAETARDGTACKKPGSKSTVKDQVLQCMKEKNKLRWRVQSKAVVPDEATSSAPAQSVAALPVVPIVSLGKSDNPAVPVKATVYLDMGTNKATSKYFLVVNAPRGLAPTCKSGGQSTGLSSTYRTGFSGRPSLEGRTNIFPIPGFPITMECFLVEAPAYKFFVVQASSSNAFETAISPITTIDLPNYVAPTPKPSPTITTSSQLNISAGQVCAPEGFSVKATDGQTYVCKKPTVGSGLRWAIQP